MIAIAIFSVDPELRRRLEPLPRTDPAITVVGTVDSPQQLLALAKRHHIDVILAKEAPVSRRFADWRHEQTGWLIFLDQANEENSREALAAGASAILPRSADRTEIVAAIRAITNGLVVFQRQLLPALLNRDASSSERSKSGDNGHLGLTTREIEVLKAMADGASNKAIARRLGISSHTVKFHVAAILEKLDADTRTEAVIKAAQLGIVML